MFNSSAFSIMNRKHKTIVNKYTKNCNKNYSRPILQPVKEEKEKQRGRESRGEKRGQLSRVPAISVSVSIRLHPLIMPSSALSYFFVSLLPKLPRHFLCSPFRPSPMRSQPPPSLLWGNLEKIINDPFSHTALVFYGLSLELPVANQPFLIFSFLKITRVIYIHWLKKKKQLPKAYN